MSAAVFGKTEPSIAEKFRAQKELLAENPEILRTRHQIFLGDARKMSELADGQVQLVVTSPPYWILKLYNGGAGEAQYISINGPDRVKSRLTGHPLPGTRAEAVLTYGMRLYVGGPT